MIFLRLAFKSLKNRWASSLLTIFSISLSILLLLAVERTKRAAEEGFTHSVSGVDLLVGARTGPINLILYTVFNMGNASNNISWESYQEFQKNADVEWTIPYSLGDSHRGYRVVATDENFYQHYQYRGSEKVQVQDGSPALGLWDVVIGSDVQKKLGYKVGQSVVIAHGVTRGEGLEFHKDKPFRVSGILKPTGTALDQSLYISLYGMEAIHIDWKDHRFQSEDSPQKAIPTLKIEDIKIHQITAFCLSTKSRIKTLSLQRQINEYPEEPLLAIIPGVVLSDLWRGLSNIEAVLKIISLMVIFVGMISMLNSLLVGLNERRREMAILRSLGASPQKIAALMVFESGLLTVMGVFFGVFLEFSSFFILKGWIENEFGVFLVGPALTSTEVYYILATLFLGVLTGLIPALKASRSALKDGLTLRI